jgi:hypothetical protein
MLDVITIEGWHVAEPQPTARHRPQKRLDGFKFHGFTMISGMYCLTLSNHAHFKAASIHSICIDRGVTPLIAVWMKAKIMPEKEACTFAERAMHAQIPGVAGLRLDKNCYITVHRALRHHAEGIFLGERLFGVTLTLSTGKLIPTRWIGERHVLEDLGRIPSFADWARTIRPEPWMSPTIRHKSEEIA